MLLNQMFEQKIVEGLTRTGKSDTAVVGWGRGMGHLGHMYLASSVITHANENKADPYFVVSRTVGKNDPLTPTEKLSIYKKVFAESKHIFQSTSDAAPDLNTILSKLQEHGYKKVIVVLGEDQVEAFQYLKNYNGKTTKAGKVLYTFESIDVISRQQTNDPSKDLAGPRSTDLRAVLLDPSKLDEDKFSVWRQSMSPVLSDDTVHMIMKLAEHRLKSLTEGGVKQALADLKDKKMSDDRFKAKYGRSKEDAKKELYNKPQTSAKVKEDNKDNGPYEYVVHYNDPKTKTSGTRTVKTTQPAPKSDSPDAAKFFGKWTSHYSAHEKRSDTANRAHHVVSQGDKKTESIASAQMAGPSGPEFPKDGGNRSLEGMLPKSAFAGTEKGYKLGREAQLKGKTKRPARAGDLVGESKYVEINEDIEKIMSSLIEQISKK